ncbi:MAG: sulfatase-like hydrolase/transferase, partial [Candidatus Margulisbacteria bacterium]|nr:sulfatase-like hydrolase/transferase [Candidatus Margulisiibacteriota bacterium]
LMAYFYILCFGLLSAYLFKTGEHLDWSVLADNITSSFSKEALTVMAGSLDPGTFLYVPVIIVIFIIFEVWKKAVSKGIQQNKHIFKFIILVTTYLFLLLIPIDSYDPIMSFFRTSINYYNNSNNVKATFEETQSTFINDGTHFNNINIPYAQKPHVFLLILESLNTSSLGKETNGIEHTPFLNNLMNKSVYAENFYGNSVQTAKGHFATMFGMIPSTSGKVFTKFSDLDVESIGTVLKRSGYDTSIFSAYHKRNFDNTYEYLIKRGFDRFQIVDKYLTEDEKKLKFGWGTPDHIFFNKFPDFFNEISISGKPQFVIIKTSVAHFPFQCVHESDRNIYPEPTKFKQYYANAINMTDKGIEVFYKKLKELGILKNSIILITADHAFPMGEHKNYHLEAGYHEESFRIPLFITWGDKLEPKIISRSFSQLDIAPTIIDLLSLDIGKNNFIGESIFSKKTDNPQYLIQPYAKHFAIIAYPLKYRYNEKVNTEYVYDLVKDPMEETNIIKSISEDKLAYFRAHLKRIYLHQSSIEKNLFWPQGETTNSFDSPK